MQRSEVGTPGSVVGKSNVVVLFEVVVTPLCLSHGWTVKGVERRQHVFKFLLTGSKVCRLG